LAAFNDKAIAFTIKEIEVEQAKIHKLRMPIVLIPDADFYLGLEDKDGNQIHRYVVYRTQVEDVIKALRKRGYPSKSFDYDKHAWMQENAKKQELQEQLDIKTKQLNEIASSCFQSTFVSVMHLKVIRAYVDGVLRFGIPPRFYMGTIFPK